LLAALVATGCLARPHRGDQAPWKGERGIAVIRARQESTARSERLFGEMV
jgi:hypothetical protein